MKQHTIKRLFGRGVLCTALLAAAACTGNFEEYNTKPYRPTDEDLVGDNVGIGILFPSMMEWMTHYQVNASQYQDVLLGDELGGYCSAVKPYQGQNISTYNPSDDFNDPLFENCFSNFYGNYFQVLSSTGGEGAVYQLAQIIRVASMLRVTDAYGPIPYKQMQNGTFSVPYDSQRDVYLAMIDDLDAAMAELYTFVSAGNTTLLADFDISNYAGDVRSWIRFANTLKLRMAIRMSGVESSAQAIAEEAVAARDTYGLIESTAQSLYFVSTSRRNPFYTQATSSSWQDLRSNANITMYMNAYADPRCSAYFSVSGYADQPYAGARSGIQDVAVTDYTLFSYPLYGETDPVPVMYAAESWFLRAEGALLGLGHGRYGREPLQQGNRIVVRGGRMLLVVQHLHADRCRHALLHRSARTPQLGQLRRGPLGGLGQRRTGARTHHHPEVDRQPHDRSRGLGRFPPDGIPQDAHGGQQPQRRQHVGYGRQRPRHAASALPAVGIRQQRRQPARRRSAAGWSRRVWHRCMVGQEKLTFKH